MWYPFCDGLKEIHLNRARSWDHVDHHICFDTFMHFFGLANPANPGKDLTEINIFGEKDNATRRWVFQFMLRTDGVGAHLLYKKSFKKKDDVIIYTTRLIRIWKRTS